MQYKDIRSFSAAVGLGQVLSLLVCGTAVTSGVLQSNKVLIPTAQSLVNYVLLAAFYSSWLAVRHGVAGLLLVIKQRGFMYCLLALIEVEANYLVVKAYQYTTVTSVQLLDCFAIPTVLVLSWLLLHARYSWLHLIGVGICMVGAGCLVVADLLVEQHPSESSNKLIGDMFCLIGAVLYGISNICQEVIVCKHGSVEYLAVIGIFASVISSIQLGILERHELMSINFHSTSTALALVGFVLSLFFLYSLMPYAISKTSAMSVNLNLLSSDFYALVLGLFVFNYTFHFLYFISFGLIVIGLVIYNVAPSNHIANSRKTEMQLTLPEPTMDILLTSSNSDLHITNNCCVESPDLNCSIANNAKIETQNTFEETYETKDSLVIINPKLVDSEILDENEIATNESTN